MGFPPRFRNWLTAQLDNRTYRVKVEGQLSESDTSEDAVPEGTVLAPLLFNLVMDEDMRWGWWFSLFLFYVTLHFSSQRS